MYTLCKEQTASRQAAPIVTVFVAELTKFAKDCPSAELWDRVAPELKTGPADPAAPHAREFRTWP